jgi:preprotein translocase subunit SecA
LVQLELNQFIAGVNGTVKTLALAEKIILMKVYGINAYTYMPSVFTSRADQFKAQLMSYYNSTDYYPKIKETIDQQVGYGRAVLVVFETAQKLHQFERSGYVDGLKLQNKLEILEETTNDEEKDQIVKKSTSIQQVTLMTRCFGRGTDFICRNQEVIRRGGAHVIQTFFASEKSEEGQIRARTARQGDPGTWELIVLDKELNKFIGPLWETE